MGSQALDLKVVLGCGEIHSGRKWLLGRIRRQGLLWQDIQESEGFVVPTPQNLVN